MKKRHLLLLLMAFAFVPLAMNGQTTELVQVTNPAQLEKSTTAWVETTTITPDEDYLIGFTDGNNNVYLIVNYAVNESNHYYYATYDRTNYGYTALASLDNNGYVTGVSGYSTDLQYCKWQFTSDGTIESSYQSDHYLNTYSDTNSSLYPGTKNNQSWTYSSGKLYRTVSDINRYAEYYHVNLEHHMRVNSQEPSSANIKLYIQKTIYTVTVSAKPEEGGTVTGSNNILAGLEHTVTANANNGYHFEKWNDNGYDLDPTTAPANYTFIVNDNHNLVANFKVNNYDINIDANITNGSVTTSPSGSANFGQNVTITLTPATGYIVGTVTVTNDDTSEPVTVTDNSFTMPASNVTITATFNPDVFTVQVSANANGSAYVGDTQGTTSTQITNGENCTVHAVANNGYHFEKWNDNGYDLDPTTAPDNYTFMVTENHTLAAYFAPDQHLLTINYKYEDDSEAADTYIRTVNYGEPYEVVSPAIEGYTPDQDTVSGTMPAENVNVTVIYTINHYVITVDSDGNGTVSGGGTYDYGNNCTVEALPNVGYLFSNWTEDGTVVSTSANYTFTVNSSRTLVATFQKEICIDDIQEIVAKEHTEGHETYILMLVYPNVDSLGNPINEEYTYQWHYSKNGESYSDLKEGTYDKQYYYRGGRLAEGYYKVRISKDGCSSYEETQPYCVNYDNRLIIYPNPSRRGDNVIVANPCDGPAQLAIYSTDGRLLHSQMLTDSQATINIQLSLGVYVAYITNSEGYTKIGKLIIQ